MGTKFDGIIYQVEKRIQNDSRKFTASLISSVSTGTAVIVHSAIYNFKDLAAQLRDSSVYGAHPTEVTAGLGIISVVSFFLLRRYYRSMMKNYDNLNSLKKARRAEEAEEFKYV